MPRSIYEEIEVVDIDDPPPVPDLTDKTKKRERRVRKSTGLGGKTRRVAITARPVRRPPPPPVSVTPPAPARKKETRSKKSIECFDIDDGDEDDDESAAGDSDSDDDIEVLEDEDPLEDGESIEEDQTPGFCDLCGLHLVGETEIEKHLSDVHKLTSCKWCQTRTRTSELKEHIQTSCAKFVKLRGTHCSIHNRTETEEDLNQPQHTNCRPLSCDTCEQRFEITSLLQKELGKELFICPGCLHGRIDPTKIITDREVEEISEDCREVTEVSDSKKEDSEVREITEITEDSSDKDITEDSTDKEETVDSEVKEIRIEKVERVVGCDTNLMKIFEVEEGDDTSIDPATVLVTEILAELLTSSLILKEPVEVDISRPSSDTSSTAESLPMLDVVAGVGNETGDSVKADTVRRVARKSSRPPLNPQRPRPGLSQEELLLLETSEPASTKRKPEQQTLDDNKPVRKIARKSTRPPANPQREKEPEIVELDEEDDEEDEDIVEIPGGFTTTVLLQSPPHDFRELEEMVLG